MTLPEILMLPAWTADRDNPYILTLTDALRQEGVRARHFKFYHPAQNADTLHVHWPERVFQNRLGSRSNSVARIYAENLLRTAERTRARGGRVFWTAHNVSPHDMPDCDRQKVWSVLRDRFFELVTDVALLSSGGRDGIIAEIPELVDARFHPVLHQHFKNFFVPGDGALFREELGIPEHATVLSTFGYIKRYKGVSGMIKAFREADLSMTHLVVAGRFERGYKSEVVTARGDCPRIHLVDKALQHEEVGNVVRGSNACLFNFAGQLNSGSLISALSLGAPVVAPQFPAGSEIAALVGPNWMYEFKGQLTPAIIGDAASRFKTRQGEPPELAELSPSEVAKRHIAAYTARDL